MTKTPVGARVGAILSASGGVVQFLGYGVYEGEQVPHGMNVGFLGTLARANIPNPRIKLDSGETVWGCECWWGSEAAIRRELETGRFAGFTVENTSINAVRVGDAKAGDDDIPSL